MILPGSGKKTFDEIMQEAFLIATAHRERMRLRNLKIRRELENGSQTKIQDFNK